ncbi:MAG: hypothetical protein AB8G23_03710 [Myxococcota bacterium]
MRIRRFLTVLVCLSTLAFAQNVVAGTPDVESASPEMSRVGGEVPKPSTTMLFVCGLAGLTAAGGRSREDEEGEE